MCIYLEVFSYFLDICSDVACSKNMYNIEYDTFDFADSPTPDAMVADRRMNGSLEVPDLSLAMSKSHSDSEILNVPVITETKAEIAAHEDKPKISPQTTPTSPLRTGQKQTEIKNNQ